MNNGWTLSLHSTPNHTFSLSYAHDKMSATLEQIRTEQDPTMISMCFWNSLACKTSQARISDLEKDLYWATGDAVHTKRIIHEFTEDLRELPEMSARCVMHLLLSHIGGVDKWQPELIICVLKTIIDRNPSIGSDIRKYHAILCTLRSFLRFTGLTVIQFVTKNIFRTHIDYVLFGLDDYAIDIDSHTKLHGRCFDLDAKNFVNYVCCWAIQHGGSLDALIALLLLILSCINL